MFEKHMLFCISENLDEVIDQLGTCMERDVFPDSQIIKRIINLVETNLKTPIQAERIKEIKIGFAW